MPIYAYRCDACGHRQDVLQKMSDPTLTVCPACSAGSFARQLSAPAFQLKGTGWYVTDFRDNGKKPAGDAGKSSDGNGNGQGGEEKSTAADSKSDSKSNGQSGGSAGDSATPAVAPAATAAKAAPATGASAGGTSAG